MHPDDFAEIVVHVSLKAREVAASQEETEEQRAEWEAALREDIERMPPPVDEHEQRLRDQIIESFRTAGMSPFTTARSDLTYEIAERWWDGWSSIVCDGSERPTATGLDQLSGLSATLWQRSKEYRDGTFGDKLSSSGRTVARRPWYGPGDGRRSPHQSASFRRGAIRCKSMADALDRFIEFVEEHPEIPPWEEAWRRVVPPSSVSVSGWPEGMTQRDHMRVLLIGAALRLHEERSGARLDFGDQNEVFFEWAAEQIGRSSSTARGVLKRAGIVNGEGKSGAAGMGLAERVEALRRYSERFDPELNGSTEDF